MAERPEDLSLPASVVARIIKDAVSIERVLFTELIFPAGSFLKVSMSLKKPEPP